MTCALFETKGGNTRFVVKDESGDEYTTFPPEFHEQQRGQYTNVYLDAISRSQAARTGKRTPTRRRRAGAPPDAAPWLVGEASSEEEVEPDELSEKLKPFKDRVAEDIREDDEA